MKEGGQAAQAGLAEILIAIDYEICMSDVDTEGIVWRRPGDAGNDFVSPAWLPSPQFHEADSLAYIIEDSGYLTCSSILRHTMPLDIGYHAWTTSGTDVLGNSRSAFLDT